MYASIKLKTSVCLRFYYHQNYKYKINIISAVHTLNSSKNNNKNDRRPISKECNIFVLDKQTDLIMYRQCIVRMNTKDVKVKWLSSPAYAYARMKRDDS